MTGRNSAWTGRLAAFVAGLFALAVPAVAQAPTLAMLGQIEPGRWELRMRAPESGVRHVCVQDGRELIQLRHPWPNCQKVVVRDTTLEVAVQYTCKGHGYGLTRIRRETARLVQVDSQGIVDGLPFAFVAEGRRIGDCGS